MPQIQTVVVFGDSLSDIGKKWTQPMGTVAYYLREMRVSPSGRFSDCRNWTDFMFEEASGVTMVVSDATATRELSRSHMTLLGAAEASFNPALGLKPDNYFMYVNYAEGGACGDTPFSKAFALGTFKDQVDTFEANCQGIPGPLRANRLGNILFIIWFGANDLYTADRPATQMHCVAHEIAVTQRSRLEDIAKIYGRSATFIFVDLARPLTSVRYQMRLEKAKNRLRGAAEEAWTVRGGQLVRVFPRASALQALQEQMEEIKNLETGVLTFNAELHRCAEINRDRVVKMGTRITEESVRALVSGHYKLKKGAAQKSANHISARNYDLLRQDPSFAAHISTIDEAHPSDEMYRLIWHEIRNQIYKADCTFGKLSFQITKTTLKQLAKKATIDGSQSSEEEVVWI
jgi:phospholipase/lecithinase/hemolysin